jgi:hypothetical protein
MPVFRFLGHRYNLAIIGDGTFVDDGAYHALRQRFHWCLNNHAELSDAQLEQFVNFVTGRSWLDDAADDADDDDDDDDDDVSPFRLAQLWFSVDYVRGNDDYVDAEMHAELFRFARVAVLPRHAASARYIVDEIWEHWFNQCDEPVEGILKYMTSDDRDDWAPFFATADDDWMPEVRAYFAAGVGPVGPVEGPVEDSDALVPSMAVLTI